MLRFFRLLAFAEGTSFLLLFALSMPLKYWAGIREPNIYIGYLHGFLFIAYIVFAIVLWKEKDWKLKHLLSLILASLLPFGTFYLEQRFLRRQEA
jgi:integral membrane protein